MELQQLERQIQRQLPRPAAVEITETKQFAIPIHTILAKYTPIRRIPMDILMKMLLLTFQSERFQDVEMVADVLLVETLFIEDLLQKMQKTGLVIVEGTIQLTEKGKAQLAAGIFEEQLEEMEQELFYSPLHGAFLQGELEEFDEFPDELPHEETATWTDEQIVAALQNDEEADEPTFITSINSAEELQIHDVPCFQYVLHDTSKNTFDIRVFNTFTNAWDEQLEQLLKASD
ncbi:nucleoside-diphosphate sugar epimerase [Metasolibacillus meyeri]|uniref:Nucleoside-diphosphate sugar epimerase n=1 Tax=Metasolibacillus meyeri TaxID=1071052 RepID=A0AAW9NN79_9BACL|nr:nucleoside-diphosphate sugar epimerase [Metasolibacillus meyeri]MEC1177194.1 nucleoside-diphosphate sugar epimerase [Metasolibacillus meyeri]